MCCFVTKLFLLSSGLEPKWCNKINRSPSDAARDTAWIEDSENKWRAKKITQKIFSVSQNDMALIKNAIEISLSTQ